jgi:hypothetical protein
MIPTIINTIINPITNLNHNTNITKEYKAKNRSFKMITKITEEPNRMVIKRHITWFDSKSMKHMKKVELQVFQCEDDENDEM